MSHVQICTHELVEFYLNVLFNYFILFLLPFLGLCLLYVDIALTCLVCLQTGVNVKYLCPTNNAQLHRIPEASPGITG